MVTAFRHAFVFSLVFAALAPPTFAKDPHPGDVNAALQARDRMLQSHRQTGVIGGGYRPYSAYTYDRAAQVHVQALKSYNNVELVPTETVREHLKAIETNTAAASKEVGKIGADNAKQAGVHDLVTSVQGHYTAAQKCCAMAEQDLNKANTPSVKGCPHCEEIEKELKAAESEHHKLLQTIGVEAVPADAQKPAAK